MIFHKHSDLFIVKLIGKIRKLFLKSTATVRLQLIHIVSSNGDLAIVSSAFLLSLLLFQWQFYDNLADLHILQLLRKFSFFMSRQSENILMIQSLQLNETFTKNMNAWNVNFHILQHTKRRR